MFRVSIAALSVTVYCVLVAVPVAAADRDGAMIGEVPTGAVIPMDGDADGALRLIQFGGASRGSVLPALYVSFAALQLVDGYTTTIGPRLGRARSQPTDVRRRPESRGLLGRQGRSNGRQHLRGGAALEEGSPRSGDCDDARVERPDGRGCGAQCLGVACPTLSPSPSPGET